MTCTVLRGPKHYGCGIRRCNCSSGSGCCRKAPGRDINSSAQSSKLSVRAVVDLQDLQRGTVPGAVVFAITAAVVAAAAMRAYLNIVARHGAEMCAQELFLACRVLQRRERCGYGIGFSNHSRKGACCSSHVARDHSSIRDGHLVWSSKLGGKGSLCHAGYCSALNAVALASDTATATAGAAAAAIAGGECATASFVAAAASATSAAAAFVSTSIALSSTTLCVSQWAAFEEFKLNEHASAGQITIILSTYDMPTAAYMQLPAWDDLR